MALLIRGKTACNLCRQVIQAEDDAVLFPSGLFAPGEPAFAVNDAAVRRACLLSTPFGAEALARCIAYAEAIGASGE